MRDDKMSWEWTSKLETGIEKIDEQHKELFNRIDRLELAIYKGQAAAELSALLEYLESYIIEHFETEEQLMLDHVYPNFAPHSREHTEFRNIFTEILDSCKNKGADSYLAIDVSKKMRKWWENHILKTDMAYKPFVKNK
jgi:hemerythrin